MSNEASEILQPLHILLLSVEAEKSICGHKLQRDQQIKIKRKESEKKNQQ